MAQQSSSVDHRKKRRRRREDVNPIPALLQAKEGLRGGDAVIAAGLYRKLFGSRPQASLVPPNNGTLRAYAAIASISTSTLPFAFEAARWLMIPVRVVSTEETEQLGLENDQVGVPPETWRSWHSVLATEGLLGNTTGVLGPGRFKIDIVDVQPLALQTIYVDVDGDALDKHYEVQKQFAGGFLGNRSNAAAVHTRDVAKRPINGYAKSQWKDDFASPQIRDFLSVVSQACDQLAVIRQNDTLRLPLPTHPITHVSFPPAKITACEPVAQGILSACTRVILTFYRRNEMSRTTVTDRSAMRGPVSMQSDSRYAYDTYDVNSETKVDTVVHSDPLLDGGSESSSDDSFGETIALNAPSLTSDSSAARSTRAYNLRGVLSSNGGRSTPGSVLSTFTNSTVRRASGGPVSLTVKAKALLEKIPDHVIHPFPASDEDDEARIFVDVKILLKIGCFSGDWVRVEPVGHSEASHAQGPFQKGSEDHSSSVARPVRIYGLPNVASLRNSRRAGKDERQQRSKISRPVSQKATLPTWMSPLLLHNLGLPAHVQLSPLTADSSGRRSFNSSKLNRHSLPPTAKEVTLLRIQSPLSTEKALQPGLFAALKSHFEYKCRILMEGDLIALPIDAATCRLLASPASPEHEFDLTQVLESMSSSQRNAVAYFKVGKIEGHLEVGVSADSSPWVGAASIEPKKTRMKQVGSKQCRVLGTLNNSWQYYFHLKRSMAHFLSPDSPSRYFAYPPKPFETSTLRRLRELFSAAISPQALYLKLDPVVVCLYSTQRATGKVTLATRAAEDLGLHVFDINTYDIITEGSAGGDVKSEAFLEARVDRALTCGPSQTAIIIRYAELLTADRIALALKNITQEVRVLVITTTAIDKIPEGVRSLFTHEMEVSAPDERERKGILQDIIQSQGLRLAHDVDLAAIAIKTAALVAGNLVDIVERTVAERQIRLQRLLRESNDKHPDVPFLLRDILVSGGDFANFITKEDFDVAVEAARKTFADAIGAPKIPNVSWDDVGGLGYVKDAVMETIQLPLERPELFASGMKKRSGILFYGPPGTGKTLLAKAIATEFSLNFFSVKGPELLNMYIGESEANVRRVFQRARDAKPCVVFFDELDSVAPKRGNQGDSGGVMDRIVSQLLAELDGMSDGKDGGGGVFVIGATNRPDLLDQALLRPGRFDKMLYLGISDTHEKQLTILRALTRKFALKPGTSLAEVADSLPFTYTGADLYALCSDAMLKAITRQTMAVETKIKALAGGPVSTAYFFDHLAQPEDITVEVSQDDFRQAQEELVGSVS